MRTAVALATLLVLLAASTAAADPPLVEKEPAPPARSTGLRIAELANVAASGLQAGWLLGGAIVSGPTRRGLDYPDYVEYQQDFLDNSNPVAPLLMPTTTVANIVPLWLMRKERKGARFWLTAAGLACNLGVIAAAAAFNVPANSDIESWSASQPPPDDWTEVRDRWETGQSLRTVFAIGAFGFNAAGALVF